MVFIFIHFFLPKFTMRTMGTEQKNKKKGQVPQNVTIFGDSVFKKAIKLKEGCQGGP